MNQRFAKSAYMNFLLWGILSSLGVTVCTLVDALLVGNLVGNSGLAVTNLATPLFLLYLLFGLTVGIGGNVLIGRHLGASETDDANRIFRALISVGLILGAVCLLCVILFRGAIFSFLGVTEKLYPLAGKYMTVVLYCAPIFILYNILSVSVRTDSDPKCAAIASAVVIIVNLSLDIFFMQVLQLGIIGASASLCIAELLGTLVLITHFFKKKSLLKLGLQLPSLRDFAEFVKNGFGVGSAFVFQALIMLVFNTLLIHSSELYGVLFVAIFGIIYTVSTIPAAVFEGASNALSTVVSIFIGEHDCESTMAVVKRALRVVIITGAALAALGAVFAGSIARYFGITNAVMQVFAAKAIRIFAISTVFTGVNTLITAFWQVIGRAKLATFMSVVRNCVLLLAFGFVLILKDQIRGLALSYLCAEFVSFGIVLGVMLIRSSKRYVEASYRFSGRSFESYYLIKKESIEQISGDITALCDEWELPPKQSFIINLFLEELLLNIIKFGLSDDRREHYIALKIMDKDEGIVLCIRDNVNSYNPFESQGDDIDMGAMRLIKQKAKACDYQRKLIFNYLYIIV